MRKIKFWYIGILILVYALPLHAQKLTSIIVDSVTQEPIPYVTIQFKNKGVISNDEGRFTLLLNEDVKETDSLFISCIGYASIGKPLKEFTDNIIYLQPKAIELTDVIVSNKNYSPEEIIEEVKKNIKNNYHLGLTKKRLFLRESYQNSVLKANYKLKESTIEAFDERFIDSVIRSIPNNDTYYNESLADLYGGNDKDVQKLNLIKASELYDKNTRLDFEGLEERFNEIIKKNVKTDSYFKIKSGLFGTKLDADDLFSSEDIDSSDVVALNKKMEETKKNEEQRRKFFLDYKRRTLGNLYKNLPFFDNSDYDVIDKSRKYEFKLENFTYIGNDAVYVLSFEPKRYADYRGKLYINSDDFAIIRMDFENVEPLRDFKLLGVSLKEYMAKGRMIFSKGEDQKYSLRYSDVVKGNRVGFKRPLKIIEKNKNVKGRRKQNELSLKIDAVFRGINRYELVVFDIKPISESQYEAFKEKNTILPTYMSQYDPAFWEGYNIIEPNTAIKEFTAKVEME